MVIDKSHHIPHCDNRVTCIVRQQNLIVQASKGCDVQLEYREWQGEYMTGPILKDAWQAMNL